MSAYAAAERLRLHHYRMHRAPKLPLAHAVSPTAGGSLCLAGMVVPTRRLLPPFFPSSSGSLMVDARAYLSTVASACLS